MFTNSGARNVETLVRCVAAQGPDGSSFELTPFLNIPSSYNALGILGSLDLEELKLRDFCKRDDRWKYVMLTSIRCIILG